MKVAVLGTSGYTGLVLLRLLSRHKGVSDIVPVSSSNPGKDIRVVDPGLWRGIVGRMITTGGKLISIEEAYDTTPDVVFAALPQLQSATLMLPFAEKSVLIDLSADLRIKKSARFQRAYGSPPPQRDLLKCSVYGLCEWYREEIRKTDVIANPGCYPTATLLPLLPLVEEGVVGGSIVVNALSGMSGAGKKAQPNYLFCERSENAGAYLPGKKHRHEPEIEEQLLELNSSISLLFTPHLAPMRRGIAATTVAELLKSISDNEIAAIFERFYGKSPFIQINRERIPQTGDVWGSNRCDIGWHQEGDKLILFSVIDNLVKGASGQAVQNMNIRFGFDESTGLELNGEL